MNKYTADAKNYVQKYRMEYSQKLSGDVKELAILSCKVYIPILNKLGKECSRIMLYESPEAEELFKQYSEMHLKGGKTDEIRDKMSILKGRIEKITLGKNEIIEQNIFNKTLPRKLKGVLSFMSGKRTFGNSVGDEDVVISGIEKVSGTVQLQGKKIGITRKKVNVMSVSWDVFNENTVSEKAAWFMKNNVYVDFFNIKMNSDPTVEKTEFSYDNFVSLMGEKREVSQEDTVKIETLTCKKKGLMSKKGKAYDEEFFFTTKKKVYSLYNLIDFSLFVLNHPKFKEIERNCQKYCLMKNGDNFAMLKGKFLKHYLSKTPQSSVFSPKYWPEGKGISEMTIDFTYSSDLKIELLLSDKIASEIDLDMIGKLGDDGNAWVILKENDRKF